MKEFDLKDYEKWCEEHKRDCSDEKALNEYKLSLNDEKSVKGLKKVKCSKGEYSYSDYNIEHFIKWCVESLKIGAKANEEAISNVEKIAIDTEKDLKEIDKEALCLIYESMFESTGELIIETMKNIKITIGLVKTMFKKEK